MRPPRIYTTHTLDRGLSVTLERGASHHLVKVLRAGTGSRLILFNGDGNDYAGVVKAAHASGAAVEITGRRSNGGESVLGLTLAQGIARGRRMDYSLQKAVELGVERIVPLFCERTGVRLSGDRLDKRLAHWRGVVIAACEQSGRATLPPVDTPWRFGAWCEALDDGGDAGSRLVLVPAAGCGPGDLRPARRITLAVGPEGGLTDGEIERARTAGFVALRLGPRTLRTETAGPAALAALQALWGDLA